MKTCSDYLKRAINGDKDALHCAFVWGDTPQGHKYWESQYLGEIPLDINVLKSMLEDDDTPTLWRDMTDAEKGALLLAHHEGKVIENTENGGKKWHGGQPCWADNFAYRIKPEPRVETVTIYARDSPWGWFTDIIQGDDDTHRITLTIRDGKVDPVAQVEEL